MSLRRIPPAVRFMVLHGLVGFGLSAIFVAAVLWADPGGVGSLILKHGGLPVIGPVDQPQQHGIAELVRLALDAYDGLRRPEILQPARHDRERFAAPVDQAAG